MNIISGLLYMSVPFQILSALLIAGSTIGFFIAISADRRDMRNLFQFTLILGVVGLVVSSFMYGALMPTETAS